MLYKWGGTGEENFNSRLGVTGHKSHTASYSVASWSTTCEIISLGKSAIEPSSVTRIATNSILGGDALIHLKRTSSSNSSGVNVGDGFESRVNNKLAQFKSIFKNDEYYDGEISKTQMFFENLYEVDINLFREVFSRGWLYAYKQSPAKLSDFICVASSIEYDKLTHYADILIIGAWSHESLRVKDSVLRAMESWCEASHLEYLNSMQAIDDIHVNAYRQRVSELLRGE